MKLKLLIAPITIIVLIIATIGMLLPKVLEVKGVFASLKKAGQEMNQTMDKIKKANEFKQELTANTEKQNILLRYIPINKQEEDIINNLDAIASEAGVASIDLELVPVNKTVLPDVAAEGDANSQLTVNAIKTIDVEVSIVGSYEQIKTFLEKTRKMQRSNEVVSLKISKILDNEGVDLGLLRAEMVLGFGYLDKITVTNVSENVLSSGGFNMSIIDEITNNAKTNFFEINTGQTGKTNPFLP